MSVLSLNPGTLFQGLIGAYPKHPIIYEALKHAYNVDTEVLNNNYFLFCKEIYDIIHSKGVVYDNIKLYNESIDESNSFANTYNTETNEKLFTHYFRNLHS